MRVNMTEHNLDIFKLIKIKREQLVAIRKENPRLAQEAYMELLTIYSVLDVESELKNEKEV